MPESMRVPVHDRTLLPFSVGPIEGIDPYDSAPILSLDVPSRQMVACGLYVGETMVAWDFVLGESTAQEVAKHLVRKWLGVRS